MSLKLKIFFVLWCVVIVLFSSWVGLSYRQKSLYDGENYNCEDMSIDCKQIFEIFGFDADLAYGHRYGIKGDVKTLQAHCWVVLNLPYWSVDFESTNLMISDVSSKYYLD